MSRTSGKFDWPAIRMEYIQGDMSQRALAATHEASFSYLSERARTEGWDNDREEYRSKALTKTIDAITDATALKVASIRSSALDVIEAAILNMGIHLHDRKLPDGTVIPAQIVTAKDMSLLLDRLGPLIGQPNNITENRNLSVDITRDLPQTSLESLRTSLQSADLTPQQWDELRSQALGQLVRTDSIEGLIAHNEFVLGNKCLPHHRRMLDHIYEGIATRTNTVNLLPRGGAKTTHGNTGLGSWLVANFPDIAIGLMSNTQDMADAFSKAIRNTVEFNPHFVELYGNLKSDQKWTDKEWVRRDSKLIGTNNSTMFARGVGGSIISKRFDILLLDDILDEENTATPEAREKVTQWLLKTVLPCLKPDGVVVVLGTRWAVEDTYELLCADETTLVGTETGKGWDLLTIPALTDLDGGPADLNDPSRLVSYWPEYWTVEKLLSKRGDLGTPLFMCAYQNDVAGLMTGNVFPSKFQHFDMLPEGKSYTIRMGVDLASSEKQRADFTARVTTAEDDEGNFYVLSVARDKRETHHAEFIHEGWLAYPNLDLVICESQQFQSTLIQEVMRDYPRIPIEGKKTDVDKTSRARAVAAKYEAGRVFHRRTLEGGDFEQELRAFPKGHDDMVDALGFSMDMGGDEFFFGAARRR